jgi:succinate-semialdehyde dehydrogenase/glutarate-semialdehyde dehydrogenase
MPIRSVNPATGEVIRDYPETDAKELEKILADARAAFLSWRQSGFGRRAGLMKSAAGLLRERQEPLAGLMAMEMGKPVREGRAEVEKCAWVCEHYAENAERFLKRQDVDTGATASCVVCRPLGVILAVMPWNFPFWQVFRFAAPALMAGNAAVLKHASNVPGCALAIEELLHEAGIPREVFRTLLIGSDRVDAVIRDRRVAAVTLTGSTPAGRSVAAVAGEQLKKTVLELGGSDPYLILEDADFPETIETCATSRLINGGQSCIAAKRFIVVDSVRERFERGLVERMRAVSMGDPLQEDVGIGPMARSDLRDELHRQVKESLAAGARLLLGGEIPDLPGAFYPPTVLTGVRVGMPAYDEELFGPVAAIIPVKNEEEAVRTANDTPFGLGAAVFTRDAARGERIAAEELEAGCCFVNDLVRSDPRLPFGGIKQSGYGRELGEIGIREFVNIKTVVLK